MKKVIFFISALMITFSLASCGENNNNNSNNPSPTPTQDVIDTKEETNTKVDDNIANDASNAIEDTGDAVGDMANDAGRAVDRVIDDTSNAMGDMMR